MILNTYVAYADWWAAVLAGGIVGGILLLIAGIYLMSDGEILVGVVSIILVLLIGIGCYRIPQTTYYEVVIDSSISWKELTNKYNVVKIRGQIITLVEKKENDYD